MFQVIDKCSNEFIKSAFRMEKVKTDTIVFRLHYKLSVWLVLLYSLAYMYVQLKMPISCTFSKGDKIASNPDVMNDYCWVHGAYSVNNSGLNRAAYSYPGVTGLTGKQNSVKYHRYYMWMYFFIVFMIILLHTPRQLWRCMENGRIQRLTENLNKYVLGKDEEVNECKEKLADYLISHLGYHGGYAMGFVTCELLNVVVSSWLMFCLDAITGHEFSRHGIASLEHVSTPALERTDPMAMVFPIMGKCTFNSYGPGGSIIPYDGLCVLPLNLINERAAVFFWYYFMAMVVVGIGALIFRMVIIVSKRTRRNILGNLTPLTATEDIALITDKCSYSDWYALTQLGSCVEPVLLREIIEMFVTKLRARDV